MISIEISDKEEYIISGLLWIFISELLSYTMPKIRGFKVYFCRKLPSLNIYFNLVIVCNKKVANKRIN